MKGNFWATFDKAVSQAVKDKEITRGQAMRLRIPSPARRRKLRTYCSQQAEMAGLVPSAGRADADGFDWESLLSFIKELLPIIMQIISIFG
jgi:D-aminopeptidase